MKIFFSDSLKAKTDTYPQHIKQELIRVINLLEQANGLGDISLNQLNIREIQNGVLALTIDKHSRLLFTAEQQEQQTIVILLDIITLSPWSALVPKSRGTHAIPASKNPMVNGSINPRINGSINPRINGSINPRINGSINPRINGSINPRINGSINPRINGSINPRVNFGYPGPFVYNLQGAKIGFLVKANDKIHLVFDLKNNFDGLLVGANDKVSIMFDTSNNWVGHLVHHDQGALQFDLQNDWVGYIA